MSDALMVYNVQTTHDHLPVAGLDSVIASVPDEVYSELDGRKGLVLSRLGRVLRTLAQQSADNLGEVLHHAQFVITGDPAEVTRRGMVHDCASCLAGVDQSLAFLSANPGQELLVGTLYWADNGEL